MTAIRYYARLFVWLFGRHREPKCATDLHFFAIRVLVRQWNARCVASPSGSISAADLMILMLPVVTSEPSRRARDLMAWVIRSRYRVWVPYLSLLPIVALFAAPRIQRQSPAPLSFLMAWRHLLIHPLQLISPKSAHYPVNAMLCLAAALLDLAQGELPSYRVALKADFYRMCRERGFPHPRTYAEQDLPLPERDYFIKPNISAQGRGVFTTADPREAERWVRQHGWIVQDRLYPHDMLRKLWKVETLGCLRINSAWGEHGPKTLGMQLKVPLADTLTDAYNTGSCMLVWVDSSGALGPVGRAVDGREYECHPLTGERFEGFSLPGVSAVIEMASRIHREVYPGVFFLGFDVAFTNQGPQFIEPNLYLGGPEVTHRPDSNAFIDSALRYMTERSYKLDG